MQQLLVIVIVIAAVLSAAWRLAGLRTRLRVLDAFGRWPLGPLSAGAVAKARRLREAGGGGCAGCAAGSAVGKRPAGR